jgi:hypothetical protein
MARNSARAASGITLDEVEAVLTRSKSNEQANQRTTEFTANAARADSKRVAKRKGQGVSAPRPSNFNLITKRILAMTHIERNDSKDNPIVCLEFSPVERNTLKGFARIKINPWHVVLEGVAIHEKNGRRWAQLPGRPQLDKDYNLIRELNGKIRYAKVMSFDSRDVADRFSASVLRAVDAKIHG